MMIIIIIIVYIYTIIIYYYYMKKLFIYDVCLIYIRSYIYIYIYISFVHLSNFRFGYIIKQENSEENFKKWYPF